jgi:hypothetical protein
MIKAILTKPLDGMPEGTPREFDKVDFDRLLALGAVRKASGLRDDGPTIAEFVARGYIASNYPPEGYASRSTPEEIASAVSEQQRRAAAATAVAASAQTAATAGAGQHGAAAAESGSAPAKAAPPVLNKKAPEPANKTAAAKG